MNDTEYRAFLAYLFHNFVRDRLDRVDQYFDWPRWPNWGSELNRLRRVMHIIRYIQSFCIDTDDIYSTFHTSTLREMVGDVRSSLNLSNLLAEEGGFLDAIDSYGTEIINGLSLEHFPESESEILRHLGSDDPKRDLQAIIYILRTRRTAFGSTANNVPVGLQLQEAEKQLSSAQEQLGELPKLVDQPVMAKKSRRWFKGLGQIAQGAALSLADIGLAVGRLHFPVSPETQTWGCLVSTTTGVGMILIGLGDFRGE